MGIADDQAAGTPPAMPGKAAGIDWRQQKLGDPFLGPALSYLRCRVVKDDVPFRLGTIQQTLEFGIGHEAALSGVSQMFLAALKMPRKRLR